MKLLFTPLLLLAGQILPAQNDSLASRVIDSVSITATRLGSDKNHLPFAVAYLDKDRLQTAQQQLSVYDALVTVPGVFVQNPDNFAQDLRISIRGFGARAAFGIRGIRIVTDGIPESTPDGQADVDNLDAGALQSLEVLKGGASALYGNASGGVIYLKTEDLPERPFVELQAGGGSYGFQRYQAKGGFRKSWGGSFLSAGYNQNTGYRQHAAMQQWIFNNKWHFHFSEKTTLALLLNYANSPKAEDPGGLTIEQANDDRRQARLQNVQFDAGEEMEQGRIGTVFTWRIDARRRLTARGFVTARQFANRLPFQNGGAVAIDRLFGGGGIQYEAEHRLFHRPYRTQAGLDADGQRDHRRRYVNTDGLQGDLTFDQDEKFSGAGVYWLNEWRPAAKWLLNWNARLDRVTLAVDDRFRSDGDQSGRKPLVRFSPSAGVSWQIRPAGFLYANLSSNYESPTLNELSANPANTGGFNPNLEPQQAWGGEAGVKAGAGKRFRLEAAVFYLALQDEFVPYQLPDFPGRTFYRNAGRSRRTGLELGGQWNVAPGMHLAFNYTWSDFRYSRFESAGQDLGGKRTPGIPRHQAYGEWRWAAPGGLTAVAQVRYTGDFYTNDANTFKNGAYTVATLRAAYRIRLKGWSLEPFAGAGNLFDARYNGNVLLNAAADRFYEPAPGIYGYGGVKVRLEG